MQDNTEKKWYFVRGFDRKSEILEATYEEIHNPRGRYQMISAWADSKEELIEKNKIHSEPCKTCGQLFCNHYSHKDLSIEGNCFSCDFWFDKVGRSKNIVVNGTLYSDGGTKDRSTYSGFLGHGGRIFNIKMNDGREFTTNNLWCGGDIPEHFRELIPDNAIFL